MTIWVHDKFNIRVHLNSEVTSHLNGCRQLRRKDTEAGGPLFSSDPGLDVEVSWCAGPFPRDRRTRHGYIPHRPSVQREIDNRHSVGQHFIGTWHTHPSVQPIASGSNVRSIGNLFKKSVHDLNLFLMIIVGTNPAPWSWEVSAFGEFGRIVLAPKKCSGQLNAVEDENLIF